MRSRGTPKHALVFAGALLVLAASPAGAAIGNQLGWASGGDAGTCPFNPLSLADYDDPCNGTGFQYLVTAVTAPPGLTAVTGEEIYIDMQVASPALPAFWYLGTGECGDGTLLMEAAFTGFATGTTSTTCRNYWGTSAPGGFHWYDEYNGVPNRARLAGVFARTPSSATLMVANGNYYTARAAFTFTQANPSGPNCAGCTIPACWILNRTLLTQPVGVGDADLTSSAGRNYVLWQGGIGGTCFGGPAQRTSWGQVKSLYR